MDINKALRTAGILAVCAAAVAAMLPLAIVGWQHRDDMGGVVTGLRLIADRSAAILGPLETGHDKQPATIAHSVVVANAAIAETGKTVAEARKPLQSATSALDTIPVVTSEARNAIVEIRKKAGPVLDNAATLEAQATDSVKKITPFAIGAVAAAKVSSGNVATITRDVKGDVTSMVKDSASITRQINAVTPTVTENVAAISTDARKIVRRAASPLTWIWGGIKAVGKKLLPFIF